MKSIALGLLATAVLATTVEAQPIFALGVPLPDMALIVCGTPEAALAQAKRSESLGREALNLDRINQSPSKGTLCQWVVVQATPSERISAVPLYYAWTVTYSAGSATSFTTKHNDKTYSIPYVFALQRTSWYFGELRDQTNQTIRAWVEIPDRPYMVDFLLNRP